MSAVRQISFGLVIACGFSVPAMAVPSKPVTNVGSGSAITCETSDVQVTSYQQVLGGTDSWSGTANSTACIGAYKGNNQPGASADLNIGTAGDGLLNGAEQQTGNTHIQFDPGAFIDTDGDPNTGTNVLLQNIAEINDQGNPYFDPNAPANDPGWVDLGQASVLGQDDIITSDFWSVTCDEGCSSGTWALTPPAEGPETLQWLLETFLPGYADSGYKTGYFDAFAILLKAGNGGEDKSCKDKKGGNDKKDGEDQEGCEGKEGGEDKEGGFAVYLFTAEDFGIDYIDTVYNFSGTFSTAALGGKALSHIAFYAHDPLYTVTDVPEPAALVLLSTGLIGLFGFSRARAGKSL